MYTLETRGQLVLTDGSFELIRVLAEDVTIREAFVIAGSYEWPDTDEMVRVGRDIFFAPAGQPFVSGTWGPLMYQPSYNIAVVDEVEDRWVASTVDHFTWGDELDDDVNGFAMAVWADGAGPRNWSPSD